jgi:hypothetical protein
MADNVFDLTPLYKSDFILPQTNCDDSIESVINFIVDSLVKIRNVVSIDYPRVFMQGKNVKPETPILPITPKYMAFAIGQSIKSNVLTETVKTYTPFGPYCKYILTKEVKIVSDLRNLQKIISEAKTSTGGVNKKEYEELETKYMTLMTENGEKTKKVNELEGKYLNLMTENEKNIKFVDELECQIRWMKSEHECALRNTEFIHNLEYQRAKAELEDLKKKNKEDIAKLKELSFYEKYVHDTVMPMDNPELKNIEESIGNYFHIVLDDYNLGNRHVQIIKATRAYIEQIENGIDLHFLSTFNIKPDDIKEKTKIILNLLETESKSIDDLMRLLNICKSKGFPSISYLYDIFSRYDDVQKICEEMSKKMYKGSFYYKKKGDETIIFGDKRAVADQMEDLKEQVAQLQNDLRKYVQKYNELRGKNKRKLMEKIEKMDPDISLKNNILRYVKHKYYRKKAVENLLTEIEMGNKKKGIFNKYFCGIRVSDYVKFILDGKCLIDVIYMNMDKVNKERFKYILKALTQLNKVMNCKKAIIWFRNKCAKEMGRKQAGPKVYDQMAQDIRFYNTYLIDVDITLENFLKMSHQSKIKTYYKYYKQLDRELDAKYLNRHFSKDLAVLKKTHETREMNRSIKSHQFNLMMPESNLFKITKPRLNILHTTKKIKDAIMKKTYTELSGISEVKGQLQAIETTLLRRYNRHYDERKMMKVTSRGEIVQNINIEYENMLRATEIKTSDNDKTIEAKLLERSDWVEEFNKKLGQKYDRTKWSDTSDYTSNDEYYDSDYDYY